MYIGNSSVLRIVDEGTQFSSATFLPNFSSEEI